MIDAKVWERATPLDPNERADYAEAARPLRQAMPADESEPADESA
jgi:hypothetical protein